jgi:hypothetical protein
MRDRAILLTFHDSIVRAACLDVSLRIWHLWGYIGQAERYSVFLLDTSQSLSCVFHRKESYDVYFEITLNICNFHVLEKQEFATPGTKNYEELGQTHCFLMQRVVSTIH